MNEKVILVKYISCDHARIIFREVPIELAKAFCCDERTRGANWFAGWARRINGCREVDEDEKKQFAEVLDAIKSKLENNCV